MTRFEIFLGPLHSSPPIDTFLDSVREKTTRFTARVPTTRNSQRSYLTSPPRDLPRSHTSGHAAPVAREDR